MKKTYYMIRHKIKVVVDEDKIIIKRHGGFSNTILSGLSGEKTIGINQITSIQFKSVTNFTAGYLQLGVVGDSSYRQGIFESSENENKIMFSSKTEEKNMRELHDYILEFQKSLNNNAAVNTLNIADELIKYSELFNQGVITKDELDALKKKLID